ncbi:hypothetical protein V8F44DRAFT_635902 [Aspergillus fumigatus]
MRISHLLFPHLLIGTGIWGTLLNHSHQPTGDQVGHIEALSDSSMAVCLLFVCFVFFASSAVFSLIVNRSNYSYIAFHHSLTALHCINGTPDRHPNSLRAILCSAVSLSIISDPPGTR